MPYKRKRLSSHRYTRRPSSKTWRRSRFPSVGFPVGRRLPGPPVATFGPTVRLFATGVVGIGPLGDGALGVMRNPSSAVDWTRYSPVYSQFKVNRMRLQVFYPGMPRQPVSNSPRACASCYDNDIGTGGAAISFLATGGYENALVTSAESVHTYDIRLPTATSSASSIITSAPLTSMWNDTDNSSQVLGRIWHIWDNNSANDIGIRYTVEWEVTFRGRKSTG